MPLDDPVRRRFAVAVVAATAFLVGIVAELVAYDAAEIRVWAPDLAVGWALVALGLAGWCVALACRERPASVPGRLRVVLRQLRRCRHPSGRVGR